VSSRSLCVRTTQFFLNSAGGINDGEGRTVPAINLAEDYDRLLAQPWVKHGTRLKLNEIKAVLEGLPASSSVSVVKPDDVIAELFSRSGSGTIVRTGERILRLRLGRGRRQGRRRHGDAARSLRVGVWRPPRRRLL
jgi:acetylglutamate synthase